MNYRPMVNVGRGEWCDNGLVFATKIEAAACAINLMHRWILVVETRVDEIDAPVNNAWIDGRLEPIEKASAG